MGSIVVIFFLISKLPELPPFYGLFIPILALAILTLWGLNTLYSSYRKKKAIEQLERQRYIREGVMVVCSKCGMETMIKCPSCGKQLYREVLYCTTCGNAFDK